MRLVGLVGKKRSGKDTVCCIIRELAVCDGLSSERIAFADAVKEECAEKLGESIEFMESRKDIFRPFYQWYGTEYRRGLRGEDYWTKQAGEKVARSKADVVIFTDVRFKNEAAFIRENGGILLRVNRPGNDDTDQHRSELEVDEIDCDFGIENDDTLDRLRSRVKILWDLDIKPDGVEDREALDGIKEV